MVATLVPQYSEKQELNLIHGLEKGSILLVHFGAIYEKRNYCELS